MGTTVTGLAPGLSRKLKKVLESRTDSPDLLSSLNTLSSFYTDNTPQSRRNLRSTIEKRSLSINLEFLAASDVVQLVINTLLMLQLLHFTCLHCSDLTSFVLLFLDCIFRPWIAWRKRRMPLLNAVTGVNLLSLLHL